MGVITPPKSLALFCLAHFVLFVKQNIFELWLLHIGACINFLQCQFMLDLIYINSTSQSSMHVCSKVQFSAPPRKIWGGRTTCSTSGVHIFSSLTDFSPQFSFAAQGESGIVRPSLLSEKQLLQGFIYTPPRGCLPSSHLKTAPWLYTASTPSSRVTM